MDPNEEAMLLRLYNEEDKYEADVTRESGSDDREADYSVPKDSNSEHSSDEFVFNPTPILPIADVTDSTENCSEESIVNRMLSPPTVNEIVADIVTHLPWTRHITLIWTIIITVFCCQTNCFGVKHIQLGLID